MNSASTLMWGMILGSIGFGFFVYGKKQRAVIPFISGIALIALPYFIPNIYIFVISGIILILLPFIIKI